VTANAARERSRPAERQIEPLTGPHSPGPAPSQTPPQRVVAILAAHDRREMTLACLRSYFTQEAPGIEAGLNLRHTHATDDTSSQIDVSWCARKICLPDPSVGTAGARGSRGLSSGR